MRPVYRLKQAWRHLTGRYAPIDWELLRSELDAFNLDLFAAMSPGDRAHAFCVYQLLRKNGRVSPDLVRAALLHDIGKTNSGLSLFHRSLIVILQALAPGALHRLAASKATWYKPFAIYSQHASLGARAAKRSGCSERTVWLIANHDLKSGTGTGMIKDTELAALQTADEKC